MASNFPVLMWWVYPFKIKDATRQYNMIQLVRPKRGDIVLEGKRIAHAQRQLVHLLAVDCTFDRVRSDPVGRGEHMPKNILRGACFVDRRRIVQLHPQRDRPGLRRTCIHRYLDGLPAAF